MTEHAGEPGEGGTRACAGPPHVPHPGAEGGGEAALANGPRAALSEMKPLVRSQLRAPDFKVCPLVSLQKYS